MSYRVFVAVLLKVGCRGVTTTTGTELPRALSALWHRVLCGSGGLCGCRHEKMSAEMWCVGLHNVQQDFKLIRDVRFAENLSGAP